MQVTESIHQNHKYTGLLHACYHSFWRPVVKLWGTAFPFRFWRGNAIPLAYTTAVGGRGGTWRTPASTPPSAKV